MVPGLVTPVHIIIRWYHSALTGREAETLLLTKGQSGSYLVRATVHYPGNHVLSARVEEQVSHVIIRNKEGMFDVGGGPNFGSLNELVYHYQKNSMVETSGTVIHLKQPFHATGFLPAIYTNSSIGITQAEWLLGRV